MAAMHKPFLKWAGGKYRLLTEIKKILPRGERLIEPFVGSGSVFLNTEFKYYQLNDANADLIHLYCTLQKCGNEFIDYAQRYFQPKYNCAERYYAMRKKFNQLNHNARQPFEKAALFLYLNRHGFNGLCRYNSKGEFNVPFGRYVRPYFPQQEMLQFHLKSQQATFTCAPFMQTMHAATQKHVIYCDPPYVPLTASAHFTRYTKEDFGLTEQAQLANISQQLCAQGIPVLISNHDTPYTRKLYHSAQLRSFYVQRMISCKAKQRKPARELLALYT